MINNNIKRKTKMLYYRKARNTEQEATEIGNVGH